MATVFRRNSIPVRAIDHSRGLVQGDPIRVQYRWGNDPVAERLGCPRSPAAESRLETGLWEVTVSAETTPSGYARVQPIVTGTAQLRESIGVNAAEADMACTLRPEFVARLESEIQRVAEELTRAGGDGQRTSN